MRIESKLSVCESIAEKIRREIALGLVAKDEKLPSCRDLALEMGVNPNTVQRAYSMLEEQGVLYTVPKKGVYAGDLSRDLSAEMKKQLRALKAAGVTKEQLRAAIDEIFSEDNHD